VVVHALSWVQADRCIYLLLERHKRRRGTPARAQCPAGIDICVAGDMADCIWVLHEGEVRGSPGQHAGVLHGMAAAR
jgi:hypothetical protein